VAAPDDVQERIRRLVRASLGREVEDVQAIEPGLGSRRFHRVRLAGGDPPTVVARLEREEDPALRPAGVPPEPPLAPIRDWLARHGLPVFDLLASEPGLQVLQDVGSESLEVAARTRPLEGVHELYREACGIAARLQHVPASAAVPNFERRLDAPLFAYKADQFVEWVLPLAGGPSSARVVREAFALVAEEADAAPRRLAHRDFKAANLHVVRRADHSEGLVMIDLQGAFLAPPEYDLVCLLRDSHVALDETFVQSALEEVRPRLPDAPDAETFRRRFTLLTLTRNGKDLSRYLYAARVRGDSRYVPLLPRAIATLKAASELARDWDPRLARLADVIARVPESPCVP